MRVPAQNAFINLGVFLSPAFFQLGFQMNGSNSLALPKRKLVKELNCPGRQTGRIALVVFWLSQCRGCFDGLRPRANTEKDATAPGDAAWGQLHAGPGKAAQGKLSPAAYHCRLWVFWVADTSDDVNWYQAAGNQLHSPEPAAIGGRVAGQSNSLGPRMLRGVILLANPEAVGLYR